MQKKTHDPIVQLRHQQVGALRSRDNTIIITLPTWPQRAIALRPQEALKLASDIQTAWGKAMNDDRTLDSVLNNLIQYYLALQDTLAKLPSPELKEHVRGSKPGSQPPASVSALAEKSEEVDAVIHDMATDIKMNCRGTTGFPNSSTYGRALAELRWIRANITWLFEYPDLEGLLDTCDRISLSMSSIIYPPWDVVGELPEFATVEQLANYFGISNSGLRNRIQRGTLTVHGVKPTEYIFGGVRHYKTSGIE